MNPENENSNLAVNQSGGSPLTAHNVFTAVFRFLHAVRMRKGIMLLWMFIAALGGAAYYATAPRKYDAEASVLIIAPEGSINHNGNQNDGVAKIMPTHVRLVSSHEVLNKASAKLHADYRIDLKGVRKEYWADAIQKNLRVSYERTTNLIDIRYRSLSPQAAAEIVNSIITEYQAFVNENNTDTVMVTLKTLTDRSKELEGELRSLEQKLRELRQSQGEIMVDDGKSMNMERDKLVSLEQDLIKAESQSRDAEAFKQSIENAITSGQDLMQYAITALDSVGRDYVALELGVTQQDAALQSQVYQRYIQNQAELTNLQRLYGERHSVVQDLQSRLNTDLAWLQGVQVQRRQKLQQLQSAELASRLQSCADQRLQAARDRQQFIRSQFDDANQRYQLVAGPIQDIM